MCPTQVSEDGGRQGVGNAAGKQYGIARGFQDITWEIWEMVLESGSSRKGRGVGTREELHPEGRHSLQ